MRPLAHFTRHAIRFLFGVTHPAIAACWAGCAERAATRLWCRRLPSNANPLNPPREHSIRFDSARLFDDLVQSSIPPSDRIGRMYTIFKVDRLRHAPHTPAQRSAGTGIRYTRNYDNITADTELKVPNADLLCIPRATNSVNESLRLHGLILKLRHSIHDKVKDSQISMQILAS